jgi:hypothetical protein
MTMRQFDIDCRTSIGKVNATLAANVGCDNPCEIINGGYKRPKALLNKSA